MHMKPPPVGMIACAHAEKSACAVSQSQRTIFVLCPSCTLRLIGRMGPLIVDANKLRARGLRKVSGAQPVAGYAKLTWFVRYLWRRGKDSLEVPIEEFRQTGAVEMVGIEVEARLVHGAREVVERNLLPLK